MNRFFLLILSLFILGCDSDSGGDCITGIYDCLGVCDGLAVEDCLGECDGDAVEDECGICNGDGFNEYGCCADIMPDCSGLCGGTSEYDCAGVCDGDTGIVDGQCDCEGNPPTSFDNPNALWGDICSDYSTSFSDCLVKGCSIVCEGGCPTIENSPYEWEDYFIGCETPANSCYCIDDSKFHAELYNCDGDCMVDIDCYGACGGDAVDDECGVCNGPGAIYECGCENSEENYDCDGNCIIDEDCNGQCGGNAVEDCAGVCDGDAMLDCAGICDNDPSNDALLNCEGQCGGTANCSVVEGWDEDACDMPLNTLYLKDDGTVLYHSDTDIGGFQFDIIGNSSINGGSGGEAQEAGFVVQGGPVGSESGNGTVIGFSFAGTYVPAGSGILTVLNLDDVSTGQGLVNIAASDPDAITLDFNYCGE
jgi:hypothetical protein